MDAWHAKLAASGANPSDAQTLCSYIILLPAVRLGALCASRVQFAPAPHGSWRYFYTFRPKSLAVRKKVCTFASAYRVDDMNITSYIQETIIIREPSERMKSLIEEMRKHKAMRREQMRNTEPQFIVNV